MIGKNISLRALEPSDVELLYKWENNPDVWFISNTVTPFSKFVLEQYVMNSHEDIYTTKQLRLMIDRTDGKHIKTVGSIDLFDFDPKHQRAGVGILIISEEQNKGYASEALSLLTKYCFNTLGLHQLYCNIREKNPKSVRLFEKHGFEIVGLKKEWLLIDQVYENEYLLQLINRDKKSA